MKFIREIRNGIIIFLGIGIYFIALELMNLSQYFPLRILNIVFVIYGVNLTLKENFRSGIRGYNTNFLSAVITSMIGAILSIAGLLIYINLNGGEEYLQNLSENFIFGGGSLTKEQYCIGLLFEAVAASLIVSFCLMQYWKDKVEVINRVDARTNQP